MHRRAPAELILTLEAKGFISRVPGEARSIRLTIGREELPELGEFSVTGEQTADRPDQVKAFSATVYRIGTEWVEECDLREAGMLGIQQVVAFS